MKSRSAAEAIRDDIRKGASKTQESAFGTADEYREYQVQLISAAQANVNKFFEYLQKAVQAQSIPKLMELSNSHLRQQFKMVAQQSREAAGLRTPADCSHRELIVAELKPIGLGGFPHGKLSNSRPKWSHSTVAGSSRPVGY